MRDNKFRVWDGKHLIYFNFRLINQESNSWYNHTIANKSIDDFIGIQDKSNKDIYECDILRHNDNLYYVKFSKNQFVLLLKEIGSKTNWRSLEWCHNVKKYIGIIGNIYENPELMGAK